MDGLFVILHVAIALGGAFVIVEGGARRNDVDHDQSLVRDGGLQQGGQLLLVAGEGPRDERRPPLQGQHAAIERRQFVGAAGLGFRSYVGRGRKLTLRQSIDAVVFDDVNVRQVAAQQVHELAQADRGRIAVAADADAEDAAIREQRARGDRRHASVDGVESMREAEEIGRRFGRTADARKLRDVPRLNAEIVERFHDAFGDGVVAATGAEGGLRTFIVQDLQANAIYFLRWWWRRNRGAHMPSWRINSSDRVRASSGRPP